MIEQINSFFSVTYIGCTKKIGYQIQEHRGQYENTHNFGPIPSFFVNNNKKSSSLYIFIYYLTKLQKRSFSNTKLKPSKNQNGLPTYLPSYKT